MLSLPCEEVSILHHYETPICTQYLWATKAVSVRSLSTTTYPKGILQCITSDRRFGPTCWIRLKHSSLTYSVIMSLLQSFLHQFHLQSRHCSYCIIDTKTLVTCIFSWHAVVWLLQHHFMQADWHVALEWLSRTLTAKDWTLNRKPELSYCSPLASQHACL